MPKSTSQPPSPPSWVREVTEDGAWVAPELFTDDRNPRVGCTLCKHNHPNRQMDICTVGPCVTEHIIYLDPKDAEKYIIQAIAAKLGA